MDVHELTKIQSKRNVTLVLTVAGVFVLFFIYLYLYTPNHTLDITTWIIIGIVALATVISGAFFAHYYTIASSYETLYGGSLNIGSSQRSLLNALTRDRILVPLEFLNLSGDYKQVYKESLMTYLQSFPNASLPVTLKCLEVALKEKHTKLKAVVNQSLSKEDQEFVDKVDKQIKHNSSYKKNPDVDSVDLFNLIECAQTYFKNQKDTLQYLRDVRNSIHTRQIVLPTDAQLAISRIAGGLNILFPLPTTLKLNIRCRVCSGTHQYNINTSDYFIGNVLNLECKNPKVEDRAYTVTVPLYLWQ